MLIDDYEIEIRDVGLTPLLNKAAPISFKARSDWVARSGWSMTVPLYTFDDETGLRTVSPAAEAVMRPGCGVVVRDNRSQKVIYSGSAHLTQAGTATAVERSTAVVDGVQTETLEISGDTDLTRLADRLVVPPEDQERDVRGGNASTVAAEYIAAHFPTFGLRNDPRIVVDYVDSFGEIIGVSPVPYTPLLEVLRECCLRGGITIDALQNNNRQIAVMIRLPVDRTADVVFSLERGGLAEAVIGASTTVGTSVYVVGNDQVVEVNTEENALRRIEAVIDAQGDMGRNDMFALGRTWLTENAGTVSLKVKPFVSADMPRFGLDYNVGDLVSVEIADPVTGEKYRRSERVVGSEISMTADGVDVDITVGAHEQFGLLRSVRIIEDLRSEVERLKRLV